MEILVKMTEVNPNHYTVDIIGKGSITIRQYHSQRSSKHDARALAFVLSEILDCTWIEKLHGKRHSKKEANKTCPVCNDTGNWTPPTQPQVIASCPECMKTKREE